VTVERETLSDSRERQGPEAVAVMARLAPTYDFKAMGFGVAADMQLAGMDCFVARCGYTGAAPMSSCSLSKI